MEGEIGKIDFIRRYKKGTGLLEEEKIANECYFIIKGYVRSYYIKDGDEKTTEFYTEEQFITPSAYGEKFLLNTISNTLKILLPE